MEYIFDKNGFLKTVIHNGYAYTNGSNTSYIQLGLNNYVDVKLDYLRRKFYFVFKKNGVGYDYPTYMK